VKLRKNDPVLVIAGKDRGKKSKVRRSLPGESRVVVEGANMVKRHMKPRGQARQAGIVEAEAPLDVSNVMLLCPKCNRPARIGTRLSEGAKVRICRRYEEAID
jgi:large subunit ribosomal protein L24